VLEWLASLGIAPAAAAVAPRGPDDQRFSSVTLGPLSHRLVAVKPLLDLLSAEQKDLHATLSPAYFQGDLRHLLPSGGKGS
jgi:hypothetical protein